MKVKSFALDKHGKLLIERAGNLKFQSCPRITTEGKWIICGDWCPLFGEPEEVSLITISFIKLEICEGHSFQGRFVDGRLKE
jgi:hypothetical protein